jgi:AraC family transcriptional regulator
MIQQESIFLGKSQLRRSVGGCTVALTSYAGNTLFEEWHSHQNASISFLLNGTHEEDLFNKKHKRIPGDIKFIPAGEMHRCSNYAPDARKINLDLSGTLLKEMDTSADDIMNLLQYSAQVKFTLLKFYHELQDPANYITASVQLTLYELLHPAKTQASNKKQLPQWAVLLQQILQEEWNQPFELNDLAKRVGVHPVTISRYFPLYFSSTLSNYIRCIKVDKALAMIKITSLNLTEIAYSCGFADQAHFTRTFKEVTGYLPKDFRRM